MATKKSAAQPPVDVPAFLSAVEHHKYLARVKASLSKTWNLSRPGTLSAAAQLGWYLVALGRDSDARELAEHVAVAAPADATGPAALEASGAIALAARLARLRGDEARRASLVARLFESITLAGAPRGAGAALAEAEKDVRSAEVDPSQKHACQGFAQGCARAATVREADAVGLDVDAVERIISQGLDGLRAQLGR